MPVLHRVIAQFPTYLPLHPGASSIERTFHLLSRDQVERFVVDSSLLGSAKALWSEALNLVGGRMAGDRRIRIRMTSLQGAAESQESAVARADAVRRYLIERWGVDSARIAIASSGAAPRAVATPALLLEPLDRGAAPLAPVETTWSAIELRAPRLDLEPEIVSVAGVRRWQVAVRYRDRVIARESSSGDSDVTALALSSDASDSSIAPLVAELVATDSTGATVVARDTLLLRLDRTLPAVGAKPSAQVTRTMILWDDRSRSGPVSQARGLLEEVIASIGEEDLVVVQGAGITAGEVATIVRRRLEERRIHPQSFEVVAAPDVRSGEIASEDPVAHVVTITVTR